MSVQYPQQEGISAVRLDENHWQQHLKQATAATGGAKTDNYAPGNFTGGVEPPGVGEPVSNYRPGQPTSPTKAAWRTVSGAKINP